MTRHEVSQRVAQSRWQARWAAIKGAPRVVALCLLILCIFGIFSLRLWNLQFVQGEAYRVRADRQRLRPVTIPTTRGIIYDRDGTPLVRNIPSFDIAIVPAYLPDDEDEAEAVLIRLAMLLDMPYTTAGTHEGGGDPPPGLREMVKEAVDSGALYRPLVVKRGVERDTALLVKQEAMVLPGVLVEVEPVRAYLYGPLVSQVLGYLLPIPEENEEEYVAQGYDPATDRIGVAGVEATYEEALRGRKGEQIVEEDVVGQVIRVVEERAAPLPGDNVYLTLDLDLQQFVEEALRRGMAQPNVNSPRGVAIVMNPQTGEILALVSLPTYDNNIFTQGPSAQDLQTLYDNPHRPLLNHAISDRLPPGSTFKIVVAAAALQEGVLTPRTRLTCPGKIIAQSCDIFFYKVGGGFEETGFEGLGVERIAHYARLFGFGEPTGVELTAEISGTVPTATWKRLTYGESWSTGDNAVNVVANGGTLYRPRIVHHVTDAQGNVVQPFEPEIIRTLPVSPENWSLVQQGMEGAVAYGTAARRGQIEGLRIAGKTGTAQYCDDIALATGECGVGYAQPEHAWFAAFAPVEKPEVSVLVFLYHGGEGSVAAVPVAREILEYYFSREGAIP